MTSSIHHVELWTHDLDEVGDSWAWLFDALGWTEQQAWTNGRSWAAPDGSYVVLERPPAVTGAHDRLRAGMNHLAVTCGGVDVLSRLRSDAVVNGWHEMFADRFPHAGGPDHIALYVENDQGFEVEVVASHE